MLHRFGEEAAASPKGVAARLPEGVGDLAEIVRAIDAEGIPIADLRLHTPTLDDVFLAKTGRSLEGSEEEPASRRAARESDARRHMSAGLLTRSGPWPGAPR